MNTVFGPIKNGLYAALEQSWMETCEHEPYESFQGSPLSQDFFQFELDDYHGPTNPNDQRSTESWTGGR